MVNGLGVEKNECPPYFWIMGAKFVTQRESEPIDSVSIKLLTVHSVSEMAPCHYIHGLSCSICSHWSNVPEFLRLKTVHKLESNQIRSLQVQGLFIQRHFKHL